MPIGINSPPTTKKYQVTLICNPLVFPQLKQNSFISISMDSGDSTMTMDHFAFTGGSIIDHHNGRRTSGNFQNPPIVFHRAPSQILGEISGPLKTFMFNMTIDAILDVGGVINLFLCTTGGAYYPTNMVDPPGFFFLRITWDTSGKFIVKTAQGNGIIGSSGISDAGFSVRVVDLDAVDAAGTGT